MLSLRERVRVCHLDVGRKNIVYVGFGTVQSFTYQLGRLADRRGCCAIHLEVFEEASDAEGFLLVSIYLSGK